MRRWRTYGRTYARARAAMADRVARAGVARIPSRGYDHAAGRRDFGATVARSSKAAKMGRYPPVPHVDAHPLSRHARERAATDEDSMDVAALCASWRQRAGKPGATVTLEVERMLRNDADAAAAADADASPSSVTLVDPDASSPHWRLLLTNKNENLYNAFALEVAACAPNSVSLATGLFASASTPAAPTLARMAGLRAVVDPLATGEDLASLLDAVRALRVSVPPLPNGDPTPVALYHDCVARYTAVPRWRRHSCARLPQSVEPGRLRVRRRRRADVDALRVQARRVRAVQEPERPDKRGGPSEHASIRRRRDEPRVRLRAHDVCASRVPAAVRLEQEAEQLQRGDAAGGGGGGAQRGARGRRGDAGYADAVD